jgi:hypothetical protein
MLRAVVAVTLAAALLGTTLPAVETAQRERTATHVAGEVDQLTTAIADLRAREQAVAAQGARRVVSVRVPQRDWDHAGVDYLIIGGAPGGGTTARNGPAIAWRVSGGTERQRRLPGASVEAVATPCDRPLVVREAGRHRIVLSLVWRDGERRVLVRHVG